MTLRSAIIVSPQPSSAASKPSATSDTRSKPWLGPAPRVEKKGLYVFLWDTGAKGKFHWGLFIARSESSGVHFHQVLDDSRWLLVKAKEDVVTSEGLLAALKVGELEDTNDEWIKAVEYCVRSARVDVKSLGDFGCRSWVLGAIYELANGGFIWLDPDWYKIRHIEVEATRLALDAVAVDMQIVSQSQMTGL
ncbi:hypothetical protein D8B26_001680 [Coccidioides posadasii str. Silveira]|uniref:Uncharacterized protein n=2 Tax=Coccidioides posadasii TaxID=199306 RepID=E9CW13_COCPS|nr:conserved hypothetical protein [Coccidioides posadasii str. Silveira]KMM64966.1 hypothetical protein CPAG_01318 [Coccidioides posadasii RMSCC 3488]QVM06974.1 hypothetical protein D8B26_001680 [Coccidioides posadasii str. Silveira]